MSAVRHLAFVVEVDHQAKDGGARLILPEAWGEAHWVVSKSSHVLDEFLLGNDACLF